LYLHFFQYPLLTFEYISADDNENPISSTELSITEVLPGNPSGLATSAIIAIAVVCGVVVLSAGAAGSALYYKKLSLQAKPSLEVPMKIVGVPEITGVVVKNKLGAGNFGEVYLRNITEILLEISL
jgi:hypothetical protein